MDSHTLPSCLGSWGRFSRGADGHRLDSPQCRKLRLAQAACGPHTIRPTFVFIESILVVLLAAVFAERRRTEQRLQLALDGAALGAFSADLATGQFACDLRAAQFHGHSVLPTTIRESRRFVHPEDLRRIDG